MSRRVTAARSLSSFLPEISGGTAKPVAERVCRAVAATPFRLPDGREIGLTVSIGVSCYPNCAAIAQEVVDRADQALYVAKEAGRNRVVLYRDLLKAQIEKDPARIVELLNEGLENIQPIVTAVDTKTAFFRNHSQCTHDHAMRLGPRARSWQDGTGDAQAGGVVARRRHHCDSRLRSE